MRSFWDKLLFIFLCLICITVQTRWQLVKIWGDLWSRHFCQKKSQWKKCYQILKIFRLRYYKARKVKNERICPFWRKFLIDSKYLYKEKEICFGIIVQMWSRKCITIPTIIWHIISYGVLKMCAFWRCHSINLT